MVSFFFFFKQKTAYEMRISDWSSDVCSSDLADRGRCAQMAKTGWTGIQYVARENRQHRRCAAKQHREQIERDRAKHQAIATDIAQSVDHLAERVARSRHLGALYRFDRQQAAAGRSEQDSAEKIGRFRRERIEITAKRRPGDRTRLPGERTHCDCRSAEHTSELQSLMRISYAAF